MEGKLLGLGLFNILGLFILFVLMVIVLKVAVNKKPIPGITEAVNTI
jgi:hypothetical protein